jgi:hypothetical protein
MRFACILGSVLMAMPVAASAEGILHQKFPPGIDCAHVAAGSSREACIRSTLSPRIVPDMNRPRSVTGEGTRTPARIIPPAMPNLPSGESGNMPGTTRSGVNGAVGIGR